MLNKKTIAFAIFIFTLCALEFLLVARHSVVAAEFHSAQLLPVAQRLPDFKLQDQFGSVFVPSSFPKHWSLVFFGFTQCADICPTELQHLSALLKLAEQYKEPLNVIFISLDPEHDTPKIITNYLAHFNSQFMGVSGDRSELTKLSHFFAITDRRILTNRSLSNTSMSANNYQIEHSGRIFIIDPDMRYVGSFAPPHSTENIWADLQMIIK
jgi:protein SCO1/2